MTITTRTSVRLHLNNNYLGFRYGEERIVLDEVQRIDLNIGGDLPPGTSYRGSAFQLSTTVRDQRLAARSVNDVIPIDLHISHDGRYFIHSPGNAAAVRSIPSFPNEELSPGDTWEAYGEVIVDPFQDNALTRVPVYIGYRFEGFDTYNGEDAAVISAQYALRYRQGQDRHGDPELSAIQGRHILHIYMSADGTRPLFIRDTLDDRFQYQDGTVVTMSGFRLTFFDTPASRNTTALRERFAARQDIQEQEKPAPDRIPETGPAVAWETIPEAQAADQIRIDETELGIRLSLPALRFVADQARFLPEERNRLQSLSESLKEALRVNPDITFLVVGHTADIGLAENQLRLSVERAESMVQELVQRGIPADRFLYTGRGGTEPVADNDSPDGRALNRRAEIFIIE
ncbi:OmpA family protein [Spirochaeta dissipatitropha]